MNWLRVYILWQWEMLKKGKGCFLWTKADDGSRREIFKEETEETIRN
jgi:hypothetical protein